MRKTIIRQCDEIQKLLNEATKSVKHAAAKDPCVLLTDVASDAIDTAYSFLGSANYGFL